MKFAAVAQKLLTALIFIAIGAVATYVYFSQTQLTPQQIETSSTEERLISDPLEPTTQIGEAMLYELLLLLDPQSRTQLLDSEELFGQFAREEVINQSVIRAADANAAADDPSVRSLIHRTTQTLISEAYLNKIVSHNLADSYPNESQINEYFAEHKDTFKTPDRIHVWQIFVPAPSTAPATHINNAKALAVQIGREIRADKITFATAVQKYSKHLESKVNDGYMGLINIEELIPEIRERLPNLKLEEVSAPIVSEAGIHILKRGELVPGTALSIDVVAENIRQQLRSSAIARVRDAAVQKIQKAYPVTLDETQLALWRESLKERDWSRSANIGMGLRRK